MSKYDLTRANELIEREIFFDANILLYLFWATGSNDCETKYAKLLKILLNNKNKLFIDLTVISEVFNKAFDIEYVKYKEDNNNLRLKKKVYRDSDAGHNTIDEIYSLLKGTVFKHFNLVGNSFSKEDIVNMLVVDHLDFSDRILLEICKENNFVLLTHDRDFRDADVDILTANTRLILA
ncbi:MAG: PIN domain-containing protein [Candidatus Delongbacteria bacterium]|jgi:predicted nucleic acid-binding protein|nr:PIN domain-containing protein [Candidatus Delongbacteria bacterium]